MSAVAAANCLSTDERGGSPTPGLHKLANWKAVSDANLMSLERLMWPAAGLVDGRSGYAKPGRASTARCDAGRNRWLPPARPARHAWHHRSDPNQGSLPGPCRRSPHRRVHAGSATDWPISQPCLAAQQLLALTLGSRVGRAAALCCSAGAILYDTLRLGETVYMYKTILF